MAEVPQFPRRRRGQFLRTPGDTQTEGDTQLIREMEQRASAFDGLNQLFGRLRDQVTRTNQQEMERETRLEAQEAGAAAGERAAEGQRLTQRMVELTDPDGTKETHVLPPGVKPNDLMFVREGDVEAEVITETTEGFQPTELPLPEQEGTIWSETYRAHAINTYVNRTEVNAQRHAQEVFQENQNDPEAFRREYDSFVEGIAENLPPEVESEFLQSSERVRRSYMNEARQNRASINRNRSLQSTQEALESTQQQVFNSSRNALGNEQSTADVLDGLQHYRETLARQGPSNMSFSIGEQDFQPDPSRTGNLDVQEINELYNHVESKSKELMITGRYDRLDSFKERSDYVAHVTRQVQFPERESDLDFSIDDMLSEQEQMDVVSELNSRLKSDQQQAKQAIKMDFDDVKDMTQVLKDGDQLSTSEFRMVQDVFSRGNVLSESGVIDGSELNDVREDFSRAWVTQTKRQSIKGLPVQDLIRERDIYKQVVENPDDFSQKHVDQSRKMIDAVEDQLQRTRQGLSEDPVELAHQTGVGNISPLQIPQLEIIPPEADDETKQEIQDRNQQKRDQLDDQIEGRLRNAVEVQNHYGSPLQIFRDSERENLQNMLTDPRTTVEQKLSLASIFAERIPQHNSELKNAGYQMLKEISGKDGKGADVFAHVVGLFSEDSHTQAHRNVARSILKGQIPDENYEAPAFSDSEAEQQLREALGNQANVEQVQPIFNTIARAARMDYKARLPHEERSEGMLNEELYRESLQRVTGRVITQEGQQIGGFINFRGTNTVVPMNMNQQKFQTIANNFSKEQILEQIGENPLQQLSPQGSVPFWNNGERFTPEQVELDELQFHFAGDGRYNLFIPDSGYVSGGGRNGFYEMDMRQLANVDTSGLAFRPGGDANILPESEEPTEQRPDRLQNLRRQEIEEQIDERTGSFLKQQASDVFSGMSESLTGFGSDIPEQRDINSPEEFFRRLFRLDDTEAAETEPIINQKVSEVFSGMFDSDSEKTVGEAMADGDVEPERVVTAVEESSSTGDLQPAERNNNPGNLKFADQPGTTGRDDRNFAKFDSMEDGWEALKRQIDLDKERGDTLTEFIKGNPDGTGPYSRTDQDSYISFLSDRLDISPETPITDVPTDELGRAIVFMETNKTLEELM